MRIMVSVAMLVTACGGGDPSCADAVGKAMSAMKKDKDRDSAQAIGACEQDRWPGELRRCIAEVRDRRDYMACMMRHAPRDKGGRDVEDEDGVSKVKIAKLAIDTFAKADFPKWSLAHNDKPCPDRLMDVLTYVGKTAEDLKDPWGTPYKMICGAGQLPPGATGIAVFSFGEDRTEGTADDVKSWARAPR